MNLLVVLPIILPLVFGAVLALLRHQARTQACVSFLGSLLHTGAAIALLYQVIQDDILVSQMSGWQAPYGISLVADLLAAIMVLLTAVTGLASIATSIWSLPRSQRSPAFHPLLHFLLVGVSGAFLTGDLFNLYVCFEVMLLASFALLALEGEPEQTEGAVKYVVLNLVSSALFLSGLGVLYAVAGTLNMADISRVAMAAQEAGDDAAMRMAGLLFLIAFMIKAGLFPFFYWLPTSYHTPTVPVSALFAGLLTKVGVYALIRLYTLILPFDTLFQNILLTLGVATMLTGVFGAAAQMEIRRILAFHIISQIGYMIIAMALGTAIGLAACVFYLCHHIIVKSNLFLVGGVAADCAGSEDLRKSGGLWAWWPALGLIFLIPAMSLAGIPPLSGFVAKLGVVYASVESDAWWLVAAALFTGLFTLYSMSKIWLELFWKPHPTGVPAGVPERRYRRLLPMALLAAITVAIGFFAGPLFGLAESAGAQLVNPAAYQAAVLGATP